MPVVVERGTQYPTIVDGTVEAERETDRVRFKALLIARNFLVEGVVVEREECRGSAAEFDSGTGAADSSLTVVALGPLLQVLGDGVGGARQGTRPTAADSDIDAGFLADAE